MMPPWFWPVTVCASAAFLGLGLQRVFLGIADPWDLLMVAVYATGLGYAWRRARG